MKFRNKLFLEVFRHDTYVETLHQFAGKLFNFSRFELHSSINQGEKRIITSALNIFAWMKLRASLAHEDIARKGQLVPKNFYAEPFRNGIAAQGS